eukprot:gnl/TRDRNA2_/TRDRNA2_67426_c0_seq1.p1 gnl/TRDRNA2_/TRDRNA2_67426_c0~~gnl/TRDRNA2_/TRDRNA2_67426_c0_seq1.p1  ORF type:complete len:448 (-),score=54.09 gnl/TRDRNA2_/TRDRNA2_67426_c0_seq1:38-1315(-)
MPAGGQMVDIHAVDYSNDYRVDQEVSCCQTEKRHDLVTVQNLKYDSNTECCDSSDALPREQSLYQVTPYIQDTRGQPDSEVYRIDGRVPLSSSTALQHMSAKPSEPQVRYPGKPYGGWFNKIRSNQALPPAQHDEMGGWAKTVLQDARLGGHLFVEGALDEWKLVNEMPWVYLKIHGWTLELWQQIPGDFTTEGHQSPAAWYDLRRVIDSKCFCEKDSRCPEFDYILQIIFSEGYFKLHFRSATEVQAWQQKVVAILRADKINRGGPNVLVLDKIWLEMIQRGETDYNRIAELLEDVFTRMDWNKSGTIDSATAAELCFQSFEHRKLKLKEFDARCEAILAEKGIFGMIRNDSQSLLEEYQLRTASGGYAEINEWFCLKAVSPGELTLKEFKELFGRVCFPDGLMELEEQVWHSPASKAVLRSLQ